MGQTHAVFTALHLPQVMPISCLPYLVGDGVGLLSDLVWNTRFRIFPDDFQILGKSWVAASSVVYA